MYSYMGCTFIYSRLLLPYSNIRYANYGAGRRGGGGNKLVWALLLLARSILAGPPGCALDVLSRYGPLFVSVPSRERAGMILG